jgi:4-amino-4-deoxy-L-arabinose transferase-like glycosyltransferase
MQRLAFPATTGRNLLAVAHVRPAPRTWSRDLWLPLGVALALRLALLLVPASPSWDGVIYVRAAQQLAAGAGYTLRILNEANSATPTAFYPVGFPAVLAGLRLLGGGLLADRFMQVFASSALVPLAYLFARRADSRRAGAAAAWASALWPAGILLSSTWLAEPVFALGVGLALLPLAYARRRQRFAALLIAALGLGVLAYLRSSSLPMATLLGLGLGFSWLQQRPLWRRLLGAAVLGALLTAVACIPLAPWAYRNARRLGAPVLVSTNGGVNLLLGTRGDGGFSSIAPDEPCKTSPLREVERDRCYQRRAIDVIASDPLTWAARGLLKLVHTYGHESAPAQCFGEGLQLPAATATSVRLWALGLSRLGGLLLLVAAGAGASIVARRAAPTAQAVLFAPILALAALHAVYLGGDRYHAAVAPMLLALAGVGLARWRRGAARGHASLGQTDT